MKTSLKLSFTEKLGRKPTRAERRWLRACQRELNKAVKHVDPKDVARNFAALQFR